MPRIRVDIKYDAKTQSFRPYDENTGIALKNFNHLTYGDPDAFPNDDPATAIKTFINPLIVAGKITDNTPNTAIILKGYVTI